MLKIKNLVLRIGTILIVSSTSVGCSFEKKTDEVKHFDIQIEQETKNEMNINSSPAISSESSTITTYESAEVLPSPTLPFIATEEPAEEDNRGLVALTFDDGPSKYTEELVEVLDSYGVKSTFFVLGCNSENYPDALAAISDSGHEIAIHGDTHTSFTKLSIDQVNQEITNTMDYIASLGIESSCLVRPPYGSLNDTLKENIEYPFILWNIDTEDWKTKDKEQIKQEILDYIEPGSIILMHDTSAVHEVDIEVLNEILPELTEEYKFVTISELCDHYNIELENGKAYRKIKSDS